MIGRWRRALFIEPIRNVCVNNFKAIRNGVWTIFSADGLFRVEKAQKFTGASELTPSLHGGCMNISFHVQSSHRPPNPICNIYKAIGKRGKTPMIQRVSF
jgi:hypothetical protein